MARYEIFDNPDGGGFLLNVQSNFLDHLHTRVVVPLYPAGNVPVPVKRLQPVFAIKGAKYLLATPLLAAVPSSILGDPKRRLYHHHEDIVAALDMLFQGF